MPCRCPGTGLGEGEGEGVAVSLEGRVGTRSLDERPQCCGLSIGAG